jgi:hypothetical protein
MGAVPARATPRTRSISFRAWALQRRRRRRLQRRRPLLPNPNRVLPLSRPHPHLTHPLRDGRRVSNPRLPLVPLIPPRTPPPHRPTHPPTPHHVPVPVEWLAVTFIRTVWVRCLGPIRIRSHIHNHTHLRRMVATTLPRAMGISHHHRHHCHHTHSRHRRISMHHHADEQTREHRIHSLNYFEHMWRV